MLLNGYSRCTASAGLNLAVAVTCLTAGADWGAILGTSIGAVMLAGLWALRCCLKRSSSDHNHLFTDGERPNSPLLTPRTPQSPRSEGRRSWSSSPATYTPPPVKLLTSPKPDLAQATSSGTGPAGLLFNKEQLKKARDDLSANIEGYVTTALRSRFAGEDMSKGTTVDCSGTTCHTHRG